MAQARGVRTNSSKTAAKQVPVVQASNPQTKARKVDFEAIRARAYELYEQRGRQDGNDEADWLQAEAELRQQNGRSA